MFSCNYHNFLKNLTDLFGAYENYLYFCSRKIEKEGWQSDRSRWTRNPVYPFRVSGV